MYHFHDKIRIGFSWRGLDIMGYHMVQNGDILGLANHYDPDDNPATPVGRWALAALVLFSLCTIVVAPPIFSLAAALLLASPAWIYALVDVDERTLGGRFYFTTAAVGLAAAGLATYGYGWIGVAALALAYGTRTMLRSLKLRNQLTFWEAALMDSPRKSRPQLNYAAFLRSNEGETEEVRELLEIIIETSTTKLERVKAYANLARWYCAKGDMQKGSELAAAGLEIAPGDPDCLIVAGTSLMNLGEFDKAVARFKLALSIEECPLRGEVLGCLAISADEAGNDPDFMRAVEILVKNNGVDQTAYTLMDHPDPKAGHRWQKFIGLLKLRQAQGPQASPTPPPSTPTQTQLAGAR